MSSTLLTDQQLARARQELMKKGMAVANKLSKVLSGLDIRLDQIEGVHGLSEPGMRPEEKLRAYLNHIERRRKLLDSDPDAFARCSVCEQPILPVLIQESPWADICHVCTSKGHH